MKKILLLLVLSICGFFMVASNTNDSAIPTTTSEPQQVDIKPISNWISSHPAHTPRYGKGMFWFRVYRSTTAINQAGDYEYHIFFISQSYYSRESGLDITRPASTYVKAMSVFVDGNLVMNQLTNSTSFWLVFKGDPKQGKGDLGIIFTAAADVNVYLEWYSEPMPY